MYSKRFLQDDRIYAQISSLDTENGLDEYNVMFHVVDSTAPFDRQLVDINNALHEFLSSVDNSVLAFRRYFISDAANQQSAVADSAAKYNTSAISIVQQPPLDGTKVALWAMIVVNAKSYEDNGLFVVEKSGYKHFWIANQTIPGGDSFRQTDVLMRSYADCLEKHGLRMQDDCIRTWFFVQNVDVNYQGVVDARRELFYDYNLNKDTHYITSTGIDGRDADKNSLVKFDAYAVGGLKKEQIQFLYAKDYLNPTYEYNVTFERGVAVSYPDRKNIFLSGTASIDNKGNVVYPGNIVEQTKRMLLNSDMLLKEAGSDIQRASVMIVYLRDVADYKIVSEMYESRFPNVPRVFLLAPVCRPGWLIEMETISTIPCD